MHGAHRPPRLFATAGGFLVSACIGLAVEPGNASPLSSAEPDASLPSRNGPDASSAPGADASTPPPVDAGRDAGDVVDAGSNPSKCAGSGFVLCEDFEGAALDGHLWSPDSQNTPGSVLALDTSRAARGNSSLHLHLAPQAVGQYAGAILNQQASFPALAGAMYGRLFIYMEADPPAHNMQLVAGHQLTPHQGTYGDNINVTRFYAVQWNQSPHIDEGFNSSTQISLNRWMCLEWYYSGDSGETRTWVDGTELADIHETNWEKVTFQQFDLGLGEPEGDLVAPGGFDAWYDELALDTARIGCDR